MPSRTELDRALARSAVVGSEPRPWPFKHIHPHRLRLTGMVTEAKVWAKARLRDDHPKPFVIYSRPRSGSTLLVDLLDRVPGLRCDGELLHFATLRPRGFLRDLPKRAGPGVTAYGVKILSYQLMEVQRVTRPLAFFDALLGLDYKVIHLTRNSWDQTLSLAKAQKTGLYFGKVDGSVQLELNPTYFVALLRWNIAMLDYERDVMAHVPHIRVDYDTELRDANLHNKTVGRVCEYLGLNPPNTVQTKLRRTGGRENAQKIVNMCAVLEAVRADGLGHLIPEAARRG